jgi:hypothetical protein
VRMDDEEGTRVSVYLFTRRRVLSTTSIPPKECCVRRVLRSGLQPSSDDILVALPRIREIYGPALDIATREYRRAAGRPGFIYS